MKLAEKIILNRKQKGWSQEELAARMDISRQSVSKWESGVSTPDIDKIILLSQIFGVTTDYLLKEEDEDLALSKSEIPDTKNTTENEEKDDKKSSAKVNELYVSKEQADEYIETMKQSSIRIAIGVFLCICSPAPMMFLIGLQVGGMLHITEDMASIIGVCILLAIVAPAVCLFVSNGIKMSKWEFIEKEVITFDEITKNKFKEEAEQFAAVFAKNISIGVALCVVSIIPLMAATALDKEDLVLMMVGVLLIIVAFGVYRFVKEGIIKDSYDKFLEEGDYTRKKKVNNTKNEAFSGVYWMSVTIIYFVYSFATNKWEHSWIIWPLAGILFAIITTIINAARDKKNQE